MNYLDNIIKAELQKKLLLAQNEGRQIEEGLADRETLSLVGALKNSGFGIIAEFKRKSPSKSNINIGAQLDDYVLAYQRGGAVGLSILTNEEFFNGSDADLIRARSITQLPILRKDFTLLRSDVYQAKLIGADAVLLIVKALSRKQLVEFSKLASDLGLESLVEIHDEAELEIALDIDAPLIGVNRRNLETFQIDKGLGLKLRDKIPKDKVVIIESGFDSIDEILEIKGLGYNGVLVGEFFMKARFPEDELRSVVQKLSAV